MKSVIIILFCLFSITYVPAQKKQMVISTAQLRDKIMGGWAGQTIGVTFGGPYEFRFDGTFIGDYQPLLWYDGYLKKNNDKQPWPV